MSPVRLSENQFDSIVKRALAKIPFEVRQHLQNILVTVKDSPSELPDYVGPVDHNSILGLFVGIPLIDKSVTSPQLYPDMIYLFQRNLEKVCDTAEQLEEEIEITVVHEIAHYVGMTEERLEELGYG
ncbi:MAG TPA: metallopeptidase family protein [Syntrophorhabdaceae bacterium]|nr:metallopeptidase family protein [Syntrophorhabdaceae bacterium]